MLARRPSSCDPTRLAASTSSFTDERVFLDLCEDQDADEHRREPRHDEVQACAQFHEGQCTVPPLQQVWAARLDRARAARPPSA